MLNTKQSLHSVNVLLIEDDEVDAKWAVRALEARQANDDYLLTIEHVDRLDAAIDRLRDNNIQLVLLDLGLPDTREEFDGVDRIHAMNPDLPIVVYSGSAYDSAGLPALERGALYYYPKTASDAEGLTRTVEIALEKYRMQENLRRVIEASADGMAIFDTQGRLLFANPAALSLLGLDGRSQGDYSFPYTLDTTKSFEVVLGSRTADVRVVDIQWNGRPALLATLRDITDRLSLEKQLRHAQKMEAIGLLASGLAHDLNNILTVISGYADLAMEDLSPDSASTKNDLEEIRAASARANTLTQRLLTFSREQSNEPRRVDVGDLVRDIHSLLDRLIGEDVVIELAPAGADCTTLADPSQLEQIIINLAVNARDAMPEGGTLRIETDLVELDEQFVGTHLDISEPGNYVMLQVTDNGDGMDEDVMTHIFEPFFTTKGWDRGTGLGLATVYGIVRQNEGAIFVESRRGEGTTFKIYFPHHHEDRSTGETDRKADSDADDSGDETILLVEDETAVRRFAAQVLRSRGYTVLEAASGENALAHFDKLSSGIDLLLTDIIMPGMNGKQLADLLRESAPLLPVLYMSGYTSETVVERGILDSDVDFLQKPFSPHVLTAHVRKVLNARRSNRT